MNGHNSPFYPAAEMFEDSLPDAIAPAWRAWRKILSYKLYSLFHNTRIAAGAKFVGCSKLPCCLRWRQHALRHCGRIAAFRRASAAKAAMIEASYGMAEAMPFQNGARYGTAWLKPCPLKTARALRRAWLYHVAQESRA
jgi:hypothetical protein